MAIKFSKIDFSQHTVPSGKFIVGYDINDGVLKQKDDTQTLTVIGGGGGPFSIDDATDVDTTTNAPTIGQALIWDGTNWVPDTVGGGGIVSDTRANILTLIGSNSLVPGTFYHITDVGDGNGSNGAGVVLIAVTNNKLSLNGSFIALNADYQASGDYSGTGGGTATGEVWHAQATPSVNQVYIYKGLHYKNLTGFVGSAPVGDFVNWLALSKSLTNGYIMEIDICEFDINIANMEQNVLMRADKRGNVVYLKVV